MKRLVFKSSCRILSFFLCFSLCAQDYNLDTSLNLYWPAPSISKPNYLSPIQEPTFGTSITRITGDVGSPIQNIEGQNWRNLARHGYSTRQPWNSDESVIFLEAHRNFNGGSSLSLFLDGQTYEVIKEAQLPSGNEHRWHHNNPELFLIIRDNEIVSWNINTEEENTLLAFDGYSNVGMGYTGNFSDDGMRVAVSATRNNDNAEVVFYMDLSTQIKGVDIEIADINTIDYVSISSLGNYIVVVGSYASGGDRTKIISIDGNEIGFWDQYGMPSHYDLATDFNGDEVAVGVSKSNPHEGKLIKRRLSDGVITELTIGGWPPHSSARALGRPGWVFVWTSESLSYGPYLTEILAVKLDGSRVERISHSRNEFGNYWNQAQPCPSPSGSRVMFASDWGANSVPIQTYVADFRHLEINSTTQVNAGNDVTICEGESVTLTATNAQNYDWSTGGSTPSITVSPSGTTTYTVVGTHSDGSTSTDEVIVFVNALPNANAGEDVAICQGETITLNASGGNSYLWSTGETTQSITVNPNATTTYSVTVSQNNCEAIDEILVTVNALPNADAGDDVSIIEGETTILTASGGETYLWNTGETTQSITVSPNTTTTYSVIVYQNKCDATDEVVVTVNGSVNADAGEDETICEGESVTLTASGGDTYLWNTGETTQSITVSPNITTTYTVTALIGDVSDSDEVIVFVNALPNANAGDDITICQGEAATLNASGGDSYLWNTGETTQSITVSPNATTTYSVTVFQNNCEAIDNVIVTINALPNADAGADVSIIEGESTTLTANGGDTYLWNTGEITQSITVSPNITTTYSVIAYQNNCEASDEVVVTVNGSVNADAGENETICEGESVTLTASGGDTYLWNTGETTQSITVSPSATSNYTVIVSNEFSQDTDDVTVFVNPNPEVQVSDDVMILIGDYVTLSATGANNYEWSNGATQPNVAVNPNTTTTYFVTGFVNDCSDTKDVTVNVLEYVEADAGEDVWVCPGEQVTLTANGGESYVWNTGETTQSITVNPEEDTTYTVLVSNALDSESDEVKVYMENCEVVNPPIEEQQFEYLVYLEANNPRLLNVKLGGLQGKSRILIHDILGNAIYQELFDDNNSLPMVKQIPLDYYSSGVYLFTLQANNKKITKRLLFR